MSRRSARTSAVLPRRVDLAGRLTVLLRSVDRIVEQRLLGLGYEDVRGGHLAILLNLERTGARGSELAARAGITKQSVGEIVRDLERLDYVERRPDPRDGRARLVQPTGRGLMLIAHARQALGEVEADAVRLIGRDRYVELQRSLTELATIGDRPEPSAPSGLVAVPMGVQPAPEPAGRSR